MKATEQQVKDFKPGLYQHWKGPMYLALGLGQDSTNRDNGHSGPDESTEEPVVIYVSLDAGPHQGHICVRELWQWAEAVDWGIGVFSRFSWRGP